MSDTLLCLPDGEQALHQMLRSKIGCEMNEDKQTKIEHLKLIQGIVTRMAGNSSQMKTWAVSLVTATFVFSGLSDDPHWLVPLGGCIPVIAFWVMDARYLHLERCYIELYSAVLQNKGVKEFDLDYQPYIDNIASVWRIAWSWSVCRFFGALLIVMLILLGVLAK